MQPIFYKDLFGNVDLPPLSLSTPVTWSNCQLDSARCVLNRVFMSADWETKFPRALLTMYSHIGIDHTPLLVESALPPALNLKQVCFLLRDLSL